MNTPKKPSESTSEIKRQRTAYRNTGIAMALLLVALLVGSGATSSPGQSPSTGNLLWGGLSAIAFASLLWALYVSYRQSDERQQLVQLKAMSLSFIAVIFGLVVAQLLHALAIVSVTISVQVVLIGGIVVWMSLAKAIERRGR